MVDEWDVQPVTLEIAVDGQRDGVLATKAAHELYVQLHKFIPSAFPDVESDGDKGDPITLLALGIALVNSGAVSEMVRCLRDWLQRRPSSRSVVIRDVTGEVVWSVTAENVEDSTVIEAIKTAAIAGTPKA